MNFRKLISVCMLLVATVAWSETNFYLKDGSVLTGFIRTQPSIANSDWLIRADRALLCVPQDRVLSIQNQHFVPQEYLDSLWIQWANDNKGWEKDSLGDLGLSFCDVSLVGRSPSMLKNIHIINNEGPSSAEAGGEPVYKFVSFEQEDYTIPSSEIQKKVISPTPEDIISGTRSEYIINRGQGKGVERVLGQLIEVESLEGAKNRNDKIYTILTPEGERLRFTKSSVISETISKMNPDQDILEQVEYLDLIEIKGYEMLNEGVIVLKDHQYRTITLYIDEENSIKFPLSQIKNFSKRKNTSKYNPKTLLSGTGIMINNEEVAPTYDILYAEPYMVLQPKEDKEPIMVGTNSNLKIKGNFSQAKAIDDYALVKISNVSLTDVPKVSKVLNNKGMSRVNLFTYNDMIERAIQPASIQTSTAGITTLEYNLPLSGLYGLYNKINKDIILINVL